MLLKGKKWAAIHTDEDGNRTIVEYPEGIFIDESRETLLSELECWDTVCLIGKIEIVPIEIVELQAEDPKNAKEKPIKKGRFCPRRFG